jgi:hypothetical protein
MVLLFSFFAPFWRVAFFLRFSYTILFFLGFIQLIFIQLIFIQLVFIQLVFIQLLFIKEDSRDSVILGGITEPGAINAYKSYSFESANTMRNVIYHAVIYQRDLSRRDAITHPLCLDIRGKPRPSGHGFG